MTTATLTTADLRQFTGSENWYRHSLNRDIVYTDGAHYVAEAGGACWLLDEIALANRYQCMVKAESFQVWTLTRDRTGNGAMLTCGDGNGNTVYSKEAVPVWRGSQVSILRPGSPRQRTLHP